MAASQEYRQSRLLPFSSSLRQADIVAEAFSIKHKRHIGISQMTFGLLQVIDPKKIEFILEKHSTFNDFQRNLLFMEGLERTLPDLEEKQKPHHTLHLRQALILANSIARDERWNEIEAEHLLIGIAKCSQAQYDKQTLIETPQNVYEITESEAAD